MTEENKKFVVQVPDLDLSEGAEMLTDFSREAQRHLISARNSLLVLETVQTDSEAIDNIFKTFHTIKGLSDFLNLKDICRLTSTSEKMMDMVRKDLLIFEGNVVKLATESISSLQKLLELLDDQIANDGTLPGKYLDIGSLIFSMEEAIEHKADMSAKAVKSEVKSLPIINFEPDTSICAQIEEKLRTAKDKTTINSDLLQKLVSDFQKASKELKETQSKLQERQRELIKERELALKLTYQAQQEARAKSEYLANMSHEIRTLINAILGFTDVLKESTLEGKQREHLDTIILSGKMLLGIVNDILDFSKVESGKLKLEQVDFNLEHIVEEIFKIIRTRLQSKPVILYFDIQDNVPRNLLGDPTRLKQIFINLLDNAIKFTETGEIGLEISIDPEKKVLRNQHALHFVVRDTGIGIPDDRKSAVFESFTQADNSTTRKYGGTGLGLALCKNFIEKMNGELQVESELGKGSRFIFDIKFPEGEVSIQRKKETRLDFSGTEVLIVDGSNISTKRLLSLCQELQIKTLPIASSAKQATEILLQYESAEKKLPTITFIDTMLPNKEGFMLAYKIRQQERYRDIKLIAVSPDVKADANDDFRRAQFDVLLVRPIIKQEVADVVRLLSGQQPKEYRFISKDALEKISCEGIRVLVVEDSAPNQELLRIHLESLGCICECATNGQEAIEHLKEKEFDVCLMDLQMPVMGGIQAAKVVREELKLKIPIVALTAAEIQQEKEVCLNAGMTDYLAKPFGVAELKEKIVKCTKM